MLSKLFFSTLAIILIAGMGLFFLVSDSYQHSMQAKVEYLLGNFTKAHTLAKKAHEEDSYNKMAATIMTQSSLAMEYETYINDGKAYLDKIKQLTAKSYLEAGDKVRMKFMCEIMIERYPKLTPTVVIPQQLQDEATAIYDEFVQIYAKITA